MLSLLTPPKDPEEAASQHRRSPASRQRGVPADEGELWKILRTDAERAAVGEEMLRGPSTVSRGLSPIAGALAIGLVLINGVAAFRASQLLAALSCALLVWATISCEVAHIGTGSADLP